MFLVALFLLKRFNFSQHCAYSWHCSCSQHCSFYLCCACSWCYGYSTWYCRCCFQLGLTRWHPSWSSNPLLVPYLFLSLHSLQIFVVVIENQHCPFPKTSWKALTTWIKTHMKKIHVWQRTSRQESKRDVRLKKKGHDRKNLTMISNLLSKVP